MMTTSNRLGADLNRQRTQDALTFAQLFFTKEKDSLCDLYHPQSTLIWNGSSHKTKSAITRFYAQQDNIVSTLLSLDVQIIPPMGDVVDMIMIMAGGQLKQGESSSNFSRVFLVGPNAPESSDFKIVFDNIRTNTI